MRFLGLASLVLATVLGTSSASASFVTIDSFDNPGSELGTRSVAAPGSLTGGTLRINNGGPQPPAIVYTVSGLAANALQGKGLIQLTGASYTTEPLAGELRARVFYTGGDTVIIESVSAANPLYTFDFTGLSAAQLNSISQIQLTYSAFSAGDFRLDSLQAVPEPTTMALIGLVTAGGGVAGWRKRRARKSA